MVEQGKAIEIESVLKENRSFPPSEAFVKQANLGPEEYRQMLEKAEADTTGFWEDRARELDWFSGWEKALEWNPPFAKWFVGGKINASYNCLDRHLKSGKGDKTAIIWEGEPGEVRKLSYREVYEEVCRLSNALKKIGVEKGDRIAMYMPLVPELAISMLAAARIGATHTVIFGGFSAEAIRDRVNDCGCKVIITADGGYRRGTEINLKKTVDEALEDAPSIENVIVLKRTGSTVEIKPSRDYWWHELISQEKSEFEPERLDSEHPLFVLYTSGTTGKPKGILHSTGGYLTHVAFTTRVIFDLKDSDIYWCTADIGWVTGHSYVVYGPMANGATIFMYEGAPNYPDFDRFWDNIERHKITILYTAPTAIRAFMRWGAEYPAKHDLSSLRLLGTVGEPINPEAWMWYHKVIGAERCPIVDTWWQTETGGILISPIPGVTTTRPGTATRPLPGISADIVNKKGESVAANEGGYLIIRKPWPSMLRTLWGDDERYIKTYWSQVEGCYFAGDGARRDEEGNFWIMGRVDDVINVSGHRLGTAEIESALVSHPLVAEAAVVGRPDDIKGQAIVAFITLEAGREATEALAEELRQHVSKEIGSLAKPDDIRFTDALPKTRSGKIMRRLLRELAASGKVTGDVTTLEDFSVLEKLREDEE